LLISSIGNAADTIGNTFRVSVKVSAILFKISTGSSIAILFRLSYRYNLLIFLAMILKLFTDEDERTKAVLFFSHLCLSRLHFAGKRYSNNHADR